MQRRATPALSGNRSIRRFIERDIAGLLCRREQLPGRRWRRRRQPDGSTTDFVRRGRDDLRFDLTMY